LRQRSRPEATIADEMLKQTALDFIGEPTIWTEICAEDARDVALGGALVRAFDGIDDAAQKAAPRWGGLAAGTTRLLAGHAEIPIERNAIHGWALSIGIEISSSIQHQPQSVMVAVMKYNRYILIQ
jgi:hypothetical protein